MFKSYFNYTFLYQVISD